MRSVVVGLWIVALVLLTSLFVGQAVQQDSLVPAAPVLPAIPILGLFWLNPKEQLAGWSTFTVWLGSTYLASGAPSEYAAFLIVTVFAILGYLRSGWFLAAAWFLHIFWDFIPRELPPELERLPLACMIVDGLIGVYLAWRSVRSPWHAAIAAATVGGERVDA